MKKENKQNLKTNSALSWIARFLVFLFGFLVWLIFRRRIQVEKSSNDEKRNERPVSIAPDDEPKIFNLPNFGRFAAFLLGMIGFVLIVGALLSGFFLPGRSFIVTPAPTLLPPEPRLQVNAQGDFQAFHATQEAELNSYGWVDRQKGVVHIPIERAMQLLIQSNPPVVTEIPVGTPTP